MKPTAGQLTRYSVGQVPEDEKQLAQFLKSELLRIEQSLNEMANGQLEVTTVAPPKPRDGMLRRADGASWNPGSGAGVYCYYAASWKFLG